MTYDRNTHLLDWLTDGWTHCQHGTKEWCEAYLHNARDVIKAQDDTLASKDTALAEIRAERDGWHRLATGRCGCQFEDDGEKLVAECGYHAGQAAELALVKKALEPFAECYLHLQRHPGELPNVTMLQWRLASEAYASRAISQDGEEKC